jgi:hypothetical protein
MSAAGGRGQSGFRAEKGAFVPKIREGRSMLDQGAHGEEDNIEQN